MRKEIRKTVSKFFWPTIFAIAMGFLEATVVVYLRELYYPNGFTFPLITFPEKIFYIEIIREFATIVMLVSVGVISGNNLLQRFAYFLYCFAVWDIFYYIALKIFLNWPESLFTWDVLFLIPVAWVGPVIAPIINSLTMIILAIMIIYFQENNIPLKTNRLEWVLIILGVLIIFCTYIWDYLSIVIKEGLLSNSLTKNQKLLAAITNYQPTYFNWYTLISGELLIFYALFRIQYYSRLFKEDN
ncbi:hypothetical protein ABRY23_04270 [Melioribacteraceae bacterium 4301-Me]|uniref:hypothetical protein n=1 Tax=Pyranulibacter aquaticus TaxID=3163344 RepID=UPI003598E66D